MEHKTAQLVGLVVAVAVVAALAVGHEMVVVVLQALTTALGLAEQRREGDADDDGSSAGRVGCGC